MDWLTSALNSLRNLPVWLPKPVVGVLILVLAAIIALALHRWVRHIIRRLLEERYPYIFSFFVQMRGVTRLAVLILALSIAMPAAPFDHDTEVWFGRLLLMLVVVVIGWGAITALHIASELYLHGYRIDTPDNLQARKHITQIRVLLRTGDALIILITIGGALMTFDAVRQYGYSLFASAGVAGIIIGLAARPVLSNLFAGVQLAMMQPIRIGDTVVVEGEWGSIEDITTSYVVVRTWDWRRLIVPLSYFIEKPFQNWTRESNGALIGSVYFYLDYRAPIDAIRAKLTELCKNSRNWNGNVCSLAVTDTKQSTIEVRAIMSGNSSGQTWDLRCEVREKIIDFLQREHPEALPHQRGELGLAQAREAAQLVQQVDVHPDSATKPAAPGGERAAEK
jgi:small-conductance mechanosensitive channel